MTLLDFSLAPRRLESVRFDLLDEDLNRIGQVYPADAPTLTIDRYRQVKRSLSDVTLLPPDAQRLTFRTRLAPVWVFEDASTYRLGVFVLNDETVQPGGDGRLDAVAMGDQMTLYRENLSRAFSVSPGDSVLDRLVELHELASNPVPYVAWDHATAIATSPMAWPPGTSIADAMEELAESAGMRAWFTREGTLRFDVLPSEPDVIDLTHEIAGSLKINYSNEDSPNRWIARSNDIDSSIQGVYELPDESPHSYARRGRYVDREVELPGLVGQDAADDAAFAASLEEEFPYKDANLELPARPDLDVYSGVLLSNGQVFLLDNASTELAPSGTTDVSCQAFWEDTRTRSAEERLTFTGSEPIGGSVPPINPQTLWNPKFLAYWRTLSRKERRQLRRYLDTVAQQRLERQERKARQRAKAARRRSRARQRRAQRSRSGRVTSTDAQLKIASVVLDDDPDGTPVPVRMESDLPGLEQRVTVGFEGARPMVTGVEGGMHRCLGWAKIEDNQDISSTAATDIQDAEVEVAITQPGRLIVVTAQARFSVSGGSSTLHIDGLILRDNGAGGSYGIIGSFGSAIGIGDHGFGETLSGFAIDPSPDPGIYSYKLQADASAQPYRVAGNASAGSQTLITVWDMGADPEASS